MSWLTLPQDRDYTPYAYPAYFGTGYLEDGHVDIKPPLIHWSYKIWASFCGTSRSRHLRAWLRFLPLAGMLASICLIYASGSLAQAVVLGLLLASPTLWTHMANTEWLTVLLVSLAHALPGPWAWVALGFLPLANQKNLVLVVPVAWALGLDINSTALLFFLPGLGTLFYLSRTKRLIPFLYWCLVVPTRFGATRTFKKNVLSAARLIVPVIALLAPFIAVGHGPWMAVFLFAFLVLVASKQIVPHHFIVLALFVALASQTTWETWVAVALVWIPRDGICHWNPRLIYKFTFGGGNADYGSMMADAAKIEAWIMLNTKPDENIWVNGMENQIYLNTSRRAWRIEIPELDGIPEGVAPRVIVHCHQSAKDFDYAAYRSTVISTIGLFTLMVRE